MGDLGEQRRRQRRRDRGDDLVGLIGSGGDREQRPHASRSTVRSSSLPVAVTPSWTSATHGWPTWRASSPRISMGTSAPSRHDWPSPVHGSGSAAGAVRRRSRSPSGEISTQPIWLPVPISDRARGPTRDASSAQHPLAGIDRAQRALGAGDVLTRFRHTVTAAWPHAGADGAAPRRAPTRRQKAGQRARAGSATGPRATSARPRPHSRRGHSQGSTGGGTVVVVVVVDAPAASSRSSAVGPLPHSTPPVRQRDPLVAQRHLGQPPPVVELADEVGGGDPHVGEEHLVERARRRSSR